MACFEKRMNTSLNCFGWCYILTLNCTFRRTLLSSNLQSFFKNVLFSKKMFCAVAVNKVFNLTIICAYNSSSYRYWKFQQSSLRSFSCCGRVWRCPVLKLLNRLIIFSWLIKQQVTTYFRCEVCWNYFLVMEVAVMLTLLVDFELLVLPLVLHYSTAYEARKYVRALAGIFNGKMKVLNCTLLQRKGLSSCILCDIGRQTHH